MRRRGLVPQQEPVVAFPHTRVVVVARLRRVSKNCFLHRVIVLWT